MEIVKCTHCGMNIPKSDAIPGRKLWLNILKIDLLIK